MYTWEHLTPKYFDFILIQFVTLYVYDLMLKNDIFAGMLMDLVSPLFPSAFVFIVCVGSLSRSFSEFRNLRPRFVYLRIVGDAQEGV